MLLAAPALAAEDDHLLIESTFTITPTTAISFWGKDKEVGSVSWKDGVLKFTGDVDASAKAFFEYWWKQYAFPNSCACPEPDGNHLEPR